MIGRILLTGACLVAAALPQARLSVALADDVKTTTALAAEDWALLPVNDLERQELARDHPALLRQVSSLVARIRKVEGQRRARKNPQDDGGRRIGEHATALRERLAPLLAEAVAALNDPAIDERLLAHIRAAPRGRLRVARYAQTLPLFVEGTPDRVRSVLAHVIPRVHGALLALAGEGERVRKLAAAQGLDNARRDALAASVNQRIQQLEKRYWRLIDYIVPTPQRAALHQRLPTAHQKHESILQHVYALPDLSASQAARVQAMLEEVQAQASPDSALVKRTQATLGEAQDRRAAQKVIQAATQRLIELQRWAVVESKRILSAEQWMALEAIPPRVSLADRKQTSPQLLKGVALTDAQHERLDALRAELQGARKAYRERRLAAAARMAGMGPDSPQMAGAQMAMANAEAQGNVVQRAFNGRLLLELLTHDQVTAWVIGPGP